MRARVPLSLPDRCELGVDERTKGRLTGIQRCHKLLDVLRPRIDFGALAHLGSEQRSDTSCDLLQVVGPIWCKW